VLGRPGVVGALAAVSGTLGVSAGAVVVEAGQVRPEPGCWVGMVAGVAALAWGALAVATARWRHD
ncbi:MAG: hypothetical protein M3163_07705, partial [Actinomycetota bacterium]|nr:hypothetical protein [Actinomycetota bacterium]